MATSKHAWARASLLATLVTTLTVATASGRGSGGGGGSGDGPGLTDTLELQPRSVVLRIFTHLTGQELLTTVPALPGYNASQFGRIDAFQGNVTTTPDPNGRQIATVHGNLFYNSQTQLAYEIKGTLTMNENSGFPPNSTFNFEGESPSPLVTPVANVTVAGGTGFFACATGIVNQTALLLTQALTTYEEIIPMRVGCGFNQIDATYLFGSQP